MGSQTIFGAIELQFLLRTFSVLGMLLIALWTFSPLGGQASLRLLDKGFHRELQNQTVRYLNSDAESVLSGGADDVAQFRFLVDTLYLSSILSPLTAQSASMDQWGNIKVPTIEPLEQTSTSGADGWYYMDKMDKKNASFSSLLGVSVAGIPIDGTTNFSMESHYMQVSCANVTNVDAGNDTFGGFQVGITGLQNRSDPLYPYQQPFPTIEPANLNFNTTEDNGEKRFVAQCTLNRSSVESGITCEGRSCKVARIRRSRFDLRPPGYTPMSAGLRVATNFESTWTNVGVSHEAESSPTEFFISDPAMRNLSSNVEAGAVDLTVIPADVFSQRFSLLFNTYYQSSIAPGYRTGNFPSDLNKLNDNPIPADAPDPVGEYEGFFNSTTALYTRSTEIYICNRAWAAILLLASLLLFLLGMYGALVRYSLRGPQVLGYVSSMTRDNPYVTLPLGGCQLDGMERTRLLRDMKVQLQDVAPRYKIGHIALSNATPRSNERLRLGRQYAGLSLPEAPPEV